MDATAEFFLKSMYKFSEKPSEDLSDFWKHAASPKLKSFISNDKTGKWCIVLTPEEVDEKWLKIKEAVQKSDLLLAKVSTKAGIFQYKTHMVCVYTLDWSDRADLEKTREVLRKLGFIEPLKYKRDIETINRVYGGENEFFLTL